MNKNRTYEIANTMTSPWGTRILRFVVYELYDPCNPLQMEKMIETASEERYHRHPPNEQLLSDGGPSAPLLPHDRHTTS